METLTSDMRRVRRVIEEQRLGFVATVCPDGTPNLSPKGTTAVWDDQHLIFADTRSPQTVANLRCHPAIEINVVDVTLRKGYRFKATASVLSDGPQFDAIVSEFRRRGSLSQPERVVLMKVEHSAPDTTPKLMYILRDLGHFDWGSPATESNAIGRYAMAWEHLFLEGDERYRAIVLRKGPNAATWETNLE